MRTVAQSVCVSMFVILLAGCTPALYTRLFNTTGELITVTNSATRNVVTIAPSAEADISTYDPQARLLVRTSTHFWSYPMLDFYQSHLPLSLVEQHADVMRSYTRIDHRGRIFVLAPPNGGHAAHEIRQPPGFPISPQERPNQSTAANHSLALRVDVDLD